MKSFRISEILLVSQIKSTIFKFFQFLYIPTLSQFKKSSNRENTNRWVARFGRPIGWWRSLDRGIRRLWSRTCLGIRATLIRSIAWNVLNWVESPWTRKNRIEIETLEMLRDRTMTQWLIWRQWETVVTTVRFEGLLVYGLENDVNDPRRFMRFGTKI